MEDEDMVDCNACHVFLRVGTLLTAGFVCSPGEVPLRTAVDLTLSRKPCELGFCCYSCKAGTDSSLQDQDLPETGELLFLPLSLVIRSLQNCSAKNCSHWQAPPWLTFSCDRF